MTAMGTCFGCHKPFVFNPERVPSIVYPAENGTRREICRECVERANPKRIENGLPPIEILPGAFEPEAIE